MMQFLNWKRFIFKSPFTSRKRSGGIDAGKSSHSGIEPAGSLHKRSSLHSASPFKRQTDFSLIRSPLNPLNPRYNSYFNSRKSW